jgi:hypothetical protein
VVGYAEFSVDGKNLVPEHTEVAHAHRRKGLATKMYQFIEKKTGKKIRPSRIQTEDSEKLWGQPNRPFGSVTSAIPNLALETYAWSPAKVHEKLSQVVPIANQQMPPGMFLQHTLEKDDDVPIIRLLSGNGDPYTAERLGSFAFFSTQRGMEWFIKLFGPVPFIPQSGMVYLTYFDDRSHDEEPAGLLSMQDEDSVWASRLLTILGAPNASPALEAPPSEEGAPSILNTKPMPIETSPWFEQKGGQSQSYRNAPIVYPDLELPDALWPIGWQPGQKGQHPSISNCLESSLAVALRPVYDRMEDVWKTKKSSKVTSESLRRSKWISLAAVQSPRSTLTLSVALSTVLSLAQTSEKNQNLKSLIQSNVELPEPLKKQFIAWVDSLPQSFHTKGNSKVAIISEIKNTNVEYDTAEQWYVRYAMFTVEVKTGDETPFRMLFRGYWSSQKPGITLLEFKRFFNHQKESYESEKTFSRIESKTYPESIMPTELNDFSLDDMKRLAITRYEGKALRADSFQDFQELLDKIMVEQELEEIYRKTVAGLLNRARKAKGYDPL